MSRHISVHGLLRRALAAGVLATLALAGHAASGAPRFAVTVVGPLAPTQTFVGAAINAAGQVAGTLSETGRQPIAALWSPGGSVRRLGYLPGYGAQSHATALNAAGMVVGWSGSAGDGHAFTWTKADGMVDMGLLLPDARATSAVSVNDAGQVVLQEYTFVGHGALGTHAYAWTAAEGLVALEPTFPGLSVSAKGSNQLGQVTGYTGTPTGWEAMIWTRGSGMQALGRPAGWYNGTQGYAINDHGVVVGDSTVGCCVNAVKWTPEDGWTGLGYIPNFLGYSDAFAINNDGVIVGGSAKGEDAHDVAAIWFPGHKALDLEPFIDPADPLKPTLKLTSAVGINDAGQILANAKLDGRAQAVVLTPIE
jgi:probable HAF family extracellular repeat protein